MGPFPSGCWTCKLRHRKCDFRTPTCGECRDRSIPCYGYGPKPSWMDGATAERQELTRIKNAVKQNFRKVRKSQNHVRQVRRERSRIIRSTSPQMPVESLLTMPTPAVPERPSPSHPRLLPKVTCKGLDPSRSADLASESPGYVCSPVQNERNTSTGLHSQHPEPAHVFGPKAASLVMHYLDSVFYWQYPYFRPRSRLGNRGWLLLFLSSGGPLYQAALALSALHRNQVVSQIDYQRNQEAFEYHSKALRELSEFSRRTETETLLGNKSQLAEFASSSLMLISFEVFNGAEYDWLPHLDAVTTVLSMHSPEALLGPANSTDAAKASEEHVSNDNQPQPGLEFLMVHAIWFDILSCISTGRVPQISYRRWLETSKLEMADLMGCYNWVMIAIGDLAHLQAWKTDMKEKGTLSVPDLVMRSKEVDTRLQNGIDELEMSIKGNTKAPRAAWVSHIFALASLVLSSTIVSGPWASLPEIKDSVGKAVDVLRDWPLAISLGGLVWPLCVIGCMADPEHQPFFQSLLTNFDTGCGGFGNSRTALKIMKDCWILQQDYGRNSTDLAVPIPMGARVLLI